MRLRNLFILILILGGIENTTLLAQITIPNDKVSSASDNLTVNPFADRNVSFNLSDTGVYKPIIWGLDLAWLDEGNVRRGVAFMGKDRVDIIRSSFMPTQPLVGDTALQGDALLNTKKRIQIINKWLSDSVKVVLNDDHPSVNSYFYGNAKHWAALMDATAKLHEDAGLKVITVSPFNEPDYSATGQGTIEDFNNIVFELRKNPYFDNIRISGGNTLNNDQALYWYNYLNPTGLDEGNTHQLAGVFDTYANFYETVRANGDHATNDELHNVMEAMVGVEYGLQTGIWWGTAEYARSEFVKASDGRRLAYAEHRDNWTSASVYRTTGGKVQGFLGSSERQGVTTSFRFISKDRDVYYDGHGPQREFFIELPTGDPNTYGTPKHTNGERVINITSGGDIQPVIDGKYILVNRNSGKVMEAASGSSANGTNIRQNTSNGGTYQQWNVNPINPRNGGDFSYFTITGVASRKTLDINNFSLDNGGNLILWEKGTFWDGRQSINQVWYLEYAEDGWFYIRNQNSSLSLEVANNSTSNAANIWQWAKDGGTNQQWRFLPVDAEVEFDAPSAPANLVATANAESVRLDWSANTEDDLEGYTVFRAESEGGPYNTIARNVKTTAFVDNTRTENGQYFYKLKAVDHSLNSSEYSEIAEATTTGEHDLVAHYLFNGNTRDSSLNLNHGATLGEPSFAEGKVDSLALLINGDSAFVRLSATVANQEEITIATWVYCDERSSIQRIFEFRNDDEEYMYLTPRLRFAIKNGGSEQRLNGSALPVGEWVHVAVTLGPGYARLYRNGMLVDESTTVSVRPIDFRPIMNYIGIGSTAALRFNGRLDDFRIYNYELTSEEIAKLFDINTSAGFVEKNDEIRFDVFPNPANDILNFSLRSPNNKKGLLLSMYSIYGKLAYQKVLEDSNKGDINVSGLPSGIYMLKITSGDTLITRKIVIQH